MPTEDELRLTRKETDLLDCLRRHPGQCLPREKLLHEVWGYREGVKSRTVDVHVQRLRRKLGQVEGARLRTVFGGGYLWSPAPAVEGYPFGSPAPDRDARETEPSFRAHASGGGAGL